MNKKYKIAMFGSLDGLSYGQRRDEIFIAEALTKLGHTIYKNNETILPEVDLILCFKSNTFGVQHIDKWKTLTKAPIFIWTFDRMNRFSWFFDIAEKVDLWLGEELQESDRWKKEGIPFYWFPYHAIPNEVFKKIDNQKIYDVVFTGTPYEYQYNPNKFELLRGIQEKFDLHVFGNNESGWKNQGIKNVHPPMFDDKLSELYSKSKIVIAISNSQCEGYWSIRSSQILMCGAFCLARFTPQMEKEIKDNAVYFQTIPECLEKIGYYLNNDIERENVSNLGYEYAKKYLSTEQRVKELLIIFENRNSIYECSKKMS